MDIVRLDEHLASKHSRQRVNKNSESALLRFRKDNTGKDSDKLLIKQMEGQKENTNELKKKGENKERKSKKTERKKDVNVSVHLDRTSINKRRN